MDERNFSVLYDNQEYRVPTILPENDSPSHSHYNNTSTFFSGYVQDKIEYDNFITNITTIAQSLAGITLKSRNINIELTNPVNYGSKFTKNDCTVCNVCGPGEENVC